MADARPRGRGGSGGAARAAVAALLLLAGAGAGTAEAAALEGARHRCDDGSCVEVPGRLVSRFVQTGSLAVENERGYGIVQGSVLAEGSGNIGTLNARHGIDAVHFSVKKIAPEDAPWRAGGPGVRVQANLQVNGRVVYAGADAGAAGATAFLEEAVYTVSHAGDGGWEEHHPGHQRQWRLVEHDAFGHADRSPAGWSVGGRPASPADMAACGPGGHEFLQTRASSSSAPEAAAVADAAATLLPALTKRFGPLPKHSKLEVSARLHLLDAWRGSVAVARVDGAVVWMQPHGDAAGDDGPISLCGGAYPGDRLSVPVRVVVPHEGDFVDLEFGGLLSGAAESGSEPALGLDDVAIHVL